MRSVNEQKEKKNSGHFQNQEQQNALVPFMLAEINHNVKGAINSPDE